jgi:hypothetical protein
MQKSLPNLGVMKMFYEDFSLLLEMTGNNLHI